MIEGIFFQLTVIIVFALIVSSILRFLKQPLIIGYIVTGVLLSYFAFEMGRAEVALSAFSHLGVAFLLFMVGLNLNPRVIKDVGKVALISGLGQVVFMFFLGFGIAMLFGFSTVASIYIGIALTFSSTIIVLKLVSDKGDLESLYGRIAVGFLIVQDIVAMVVLMAISAMGQEATSFVTLAIETLLKGVGLLLLVFVVSLYFLPKISKSMAKNQEYLFLFSIGWCLLLGSLFALFSFSIEIGALIAGVTLALSPYHYEIAAKMRPLRDFFIVLFFIMLGSHIHFADIAQNLGPVIGLSLFVLIGTPLVMLAIMGILGYTRRNSFLVGLSVAQISEFSLIIITLAVGLGHISSSILSIVTSIAVLTIAGSSYLILYADKLYAFFHPYLKLFERKGPKVDLHSQRVDKAYDIILFGYNRIGYDLLHSFTTIRKQFLVVDYNPETIARLSKEKYECRYGDVGDAEFLNDLNLSHAKMCISTIPKLDVNMLLLGHVKDANPKAIFICVSHSIEETMELYRAGATYVIMPHFLGGNHTSTLIMKYGLNLKKFLRERVAHLEHLKKRQSEGHDHPSYL